MRAMILAAGRGERMGVLTENTPKPLLRVGDHYLIDYAIANLKRAGITEIIINVAYEADQIIAALGNGERYGVDIIFSKEAERLETGGGILQALPLLGDEPFIVLSSDVISHYSLSQLPKQPQGLAHLVLVKNPDFHPKGDFGLVNKLVDLDARPTFTFGSMGVYRKELFADCKLGYFPLNKILFPAIRERQVSGEIYEGVWFNVGTPEQLRDVELSTKMDLFNT